jgi:hypothetical protein
VERTGTERPPFTTTLGVLAMSKLILDYLKSGVEPFPDSNYGDGYRCSACLKDGTFLPCLVLRNSGPVVELAIRRFEQEKKGKGIFGSRSGYESIVKTFVTSGNRVNHYDIECVERADLPSLSHY